MVSLVLLATSLATSLAASSTAMGQSDRQPFINSAFADRPVQPTRFSPPNIGELNVSSVVNNYVRDISWDEWGEATAVGHGQVSLVDLASGEFELQNGEVPARTSPVTITLSGLRTCSGFLVYTDYELTLAPGAQPPSTWPKGQRGRFPCSISAGGFQPFSRAAMEGKVGEGNCGFHGLAPAGYLSELTSGPPIEQPRWKPHRPPGKGSTVFCKMLWKHWGDNVVTATGLRENLTLPHSAERNWPVRLILRHPVWCPAAATPEGENVLTYTEFTMIEYGPGRIPTHWSLSHWGHRGLKAHVFRQRLRFHRAQCGFGLSQANLAVPGWSPNPQ